MLSWAMLFGCPIAFVAVDTTNIIVAVILSFIMLGVLFLGCKDTWIMTEQQEYGWLFHDFKAKYHVYGMAGGGKPHPAGAVF